MHAYTSVHVYAFKHCTDAVYTCNLEGLCVIRSFHLQFEIRKRKNGLFLHYLFNNQIQKYKKRFVFLIFDFMLTLKIANRKMGHD